MVPPIRLLFTLLVFFEVGLGDLAGEGQCAQPLKLAIFMKTNSRSPDQVRIWLGHHRAIGFTRFFITWQLDEDLELPDLGNDVNLRVLHSNAHTVDDARAVVARRNLHAADVMAEHCFSEDLRKAVREEIDWALQIDDDELFYPRYESAQDFFTNVSKNFVALHFKNWEADYDDTSRENCFGATHFKIDGKTEGHFRGYGNGKSAGFVRDHRVSFRRGPHSVAAREDTTKINSEDAVILHYPHCPYEKWKRTFLKMSLEPKATHVEKFGFYAQSIGQIEKCSDFLTQDIPDAARTPECKEKSLKGFWESRTEIRDGDKVVELTTVPGSVKVTDETPMEASNLKPYVKKNVLDAQPTEAEGMKHLDDIMTQSKRWDGHTNHSSDTELIAEMDHLASNPSVRTICETGFNSGHSSLRWLLHSKAHVYSFDIGQHMHARPAAKWISNQFPGRFTIVWGDSMKTLPQFSAKNPIVKCDLIFVDGGHSYNVALSDLTHFQAMAQPDANIVLIHDTHCNPSWCQGPLNAWREVIQSAIVHEISHQSILNGSQGWAVGTYSPKSN